MPSAGVDIKFDAFIQYYYVTSELKLLDNINKELFLRITIYFILLSSPFTELSDILMILKGKC